MSRPPRVLRRQVNAANILGDILRPRGDFLDTAGDFMGGGDLPPDVLGRTRGLAGAVVDQADDLANPGCLAFQADGPGGGIGGTLLIRPDYNRRVTSAATGSARGASCALAWVPRYKKPTI